MNKKSKKAKKTNNSNNEKKVQIVQRIIDVSVFDPYRVYRCEEDDLVGHTE